MRAILIDDEKNSLEILEWMLSKHCPSVQIVACCSSPLEGLDKIHEQKPDLLFLDIEMPQLNGFDLLSQLDKDMTGVIFTTAYNQFAIRAFKTCAIDYLLKPIDPEDLKEAVKKAEVQKSRVTAEQMQALLDFFTTRKRGPKRIALTTSDHLVFVDSDQVIYCESDRNYTVVHLLNGEKIVVSKTLKDVEEILEGSDFYRIHASYLINLKHIAKFTRGDGGYVVMRNNHHITVSRKKKEEFFELFSKL